MTKKTPELHEKYFTSYSANFEDVMLHRLFSSRARGFYVDVGAAHPTFENDTKLFYDLGWSGINVEPNPAFFALLAAERVRDQNFCTALSDRVGKIKYYDVVDTGLSTCDEKLAEQAKNKGHKIISRRVPVSTLKDILNAVAPASIEFLKIDVEGFEERVLAGNDWTRFRPSVIIVEVTYPESPKRRPTDIRKYLTEQGYRWQYFDGLNDFYTANEFAIANEVFDRPPNVFDGFKLRALLDLETQKTNLTNQLEKELEIKDSLQVKVRAGEEYSKSLQAEVQKMQNHNISLETELRKTQDYAKFITDKVKAAEEYSKSLQTEVQKTQQQNISLETELRRAQANTKAAEEYSKLLQTEVQKTQQQNISLEAELRKTQEYAKSMNDKVKLAEKYSKSLQAEVQKMQNHNISLETELRKTQDYAKSITDKVKAAEEYSKSLQTEVQKTQQQNISLETELRTAQANTKAAEEYSKSLQTEVQKIQNYNMSLEAELRKTQEYARAMENIVKMAQEYSESLHVEAQKMQQQNESLAAELRKTEGDVKSMEAEAERAKAHVSLLNVDLANEKFERHRFEKAAVAMRNELLGFSSGLEQWHRDREELLHTKELLAITELEKRTIIASSCWKYTAPIRILGNRLNPLLRGILPYYVIRLIQHIRSR